MYLVFDIGGTKSRFAVSDDLNSFRDNPIIFYTKQSYIEQIEYLKGNLKYSGLKEGFGGIPGIQKDNKLIFSPNLKDYVGKDIDQDLKSVFNLQNITIENDALVAALGEAYFGAGKGYSSICYITLGTGVGGAIVIDGKPSNLKMFEPGHTIRNDLDGVTFEETISGGAIRKLFNGEEPGGDNTELWSNVERGLAALIENIFLLTGIELFVIGGGIILSDKVKLQSVENYLKQLSKIPIYPQLKKSVLGDYAGLYGSMILLRQSL